MHSPPARWLTHPLVALPLFVGSYYALYFSGLFAAALPAHWAHLLMNLHFVVGGAVLLAPDRHRSRAAAAAARGPAGVLFASVPFHAFFGVALMSASTVIGGEFYRALALPWVPDPLRDQQARRRPGVGVGETAPAAGGDRAARAVVAAGRAVGSSR